MSSAMPSYFINPWPPFPCINTTAIVALRDTKSHFSTTTMLPEADVEVDQTFT